jgi:hypothetical protein
MMGVEDCKLDCLIFVALRRLWPHSRVLLSNQSSEVFCVGRNDAFLYNDLARRSPVTREVIASIHLQDSGTKG